ncbi:triose-phosphate transporter family-domain-containing protein [Podospora didyma]|uniref:Triose-phosphate transporter family-domain-containing protein n=1 Tax=Podospora didyma TaxID=330526 RepID=A0AAE0U8E6_9PEZI|nr:triose-phosphate transporter family-domain-containing protein [Podospora didyma]
MSDPLPLPNAQFSSQSPSLRPPDPATTAFSDDVLTLTSPASISSHAPTPGLSNNAQRSAEPTPGSSSARANTTLQATQGEEGLGLGLGQAPDDIEMEPIVPAGHRRRRSSLINPVRGSPSRHRSPHPRAQSIRNQANGGQDEPKILEEGSEEGLGALLSDRRGEEDIPSDEDLHDDEEAGLTGRDRRRKRRRRNHNTLLDQRIVREKISPPDQKAADRSVLRKLLVNACLIGLWYFFSLCISLYNKWMFDPKTLNFPFPMFTTSVHMLVQFSLASLVLFIFPSLRPKNGHASSLGQARHQIEPEKPLMTKMFYLTRIGPCGVATGLDIGLGNTSLQFITLTFYTMCKSSSLAFVLIFAFLFRLEVPTWKLVAVIGTMTLGVVAMVAGEVEFKVGGFFLVIAAAFFSGFRWGLTQILLLRNPATSNPFSSIFFLAPVMFLTLITIAIPVEGVSALIGGLKTIAEERGTLMAPLIILFPGVIAFLMTASEFALLQRTSVVTLSIAGIFKEAVTISAAAIVFGDTMTPINIAGLFVTLAAIAAYNWIKISKMRQEAQTDVHRDQDLVDEEDDSDLDDDDDDRRSSPSPSGSDTEDTGGGGGEETAGLLRRSAEVEEVIFTADGDIVVTPEPSPKPADEQRAARQD